jgi:lipopolysaccharide transport system ATP-binding protein
MGTIRVNNLGKAYKVYGSRWSRLREWITPLNRCYHDLKWVLKGIDFTVQPASALGIIGMNGAGKSTLLKMITGTTAPTTGSVSMSGRVAALLELGMGFHPEFTGRQNAVMACQLLGIAPEEIDGLMPSIESFAEIGDYIDYPVRIYSSGMQVRLAFSVATAVRPDILIIDEALSVGDAYFQHKSFDRIRQFQALGTTLLLVSHDRQAIQSICDRAILLCDGHIAMEGSPEAVMDYYNAMLANHQNQEIQQAVKEDGRVQTISGTGEASITSVQLLTPEGGPLNFVGVGQRVVLRVQVIPRAALDNLVVGYMIKDRLGQIVFGTNTHHLALEIENLIEKLPVTVSLEFDANLGPGNYSISVAIHGDETHMNANYQWIDQAVLFNVVNTQQPTFTGIAWFPTVAHLDHE